MFSVHSISQILKTEKHKYAICPEGNGIDTHRFWESLYMNTIPICKRNILVEYYSKYFPIIILNNWNECNFQQDAKILHLHGTRGAKNTVLLQYELLRRWADVEVEPTRVEIVKDENGWPADVKSIE